MSMSTKTSHCESDFQFLTTVDQVLHQKCLILARNLAIWVFEMPIFSEFAEVSSDQVLYMYK